MDAFPAQILVLMAIWAVLAIVGFTLNLRQRDSRWVALCEFVFSGISAGGFVGIVTLVCFGDFQTWIVQSTFVPMQWSEFVYAIYSADDPVYAPAVGMAVGAFVAAWLWNRRHIKNAEPGASANAGLRPHD